MIQFELKDLIFSISQIDSFNLPSERFLLRISKDSTLNQRIVDSCIATHAFYYPYQLKNPLIKAKDLILKSWLPDGYYFHFEIVGDSLFQSWEQTIIDHKTNGFLISYENRFPEEISIIKGGKTDGFSASISSDQREVNSFYISDKKYVSRRISWHKSEYYWNEIIIKTQK